MRRLNMEIKEVEEIINNGKNIFTEIMGFSPDITDEELDRALDEILKETN